MLLDIIQHGNLVCLFISALILCKVGRLFAIQELYRWGFIIAGLSFLASGAWLWTRIRPVGSEDLLEIIFRCLCVAGIALGLGWMVLSMLAITYDRLIDPTMSSVKWRRAMATAKAIAARRQLEEEALRREQEAERAQRQIELERLAAEKDRRRQHRDKVFADCLALYLLYERVIGKRFSRRAFDGFVSEFLQSWRSQHEIEEYGKKLETVIRSHYEAARPSHLSSVPALHEHLQKALEATKIIDDAVMRQKVETSLREQFEQMAPIIGLGAGR